MSSPHRVGTMTLGAEQKNSKRGYLWGQSALVMEKSHLGVERKTQGDICKEQSSQRLPRTGRNRSLYKPCLEISLDGCSEGYRDQRLQQCSAGEKGIYF